MAEVVEITDPVNIPESESQLASLKRGDLARVTLGEGFSDLTMVYEGLDKQGRDSFLMQDENGRELMYSWKSYRRCFQFDSQHGVMFSHHHRYLEAYDKNTKAKVWYSKKNLLEKAKRWRRE